jgi:hypothetical protein
MGAIGTQRVFKDLKAQEHKPIELERGSQSYKIWKAIKIKRIRVPDIFCVKCGKRIECRAKSTLEISMSHSTSDPERAWDYGLQDTDYIALVGCEKSDSTPIGWVADELVQYGLVSEMRRARQRRLVKTLKPKGSEEGFELRLIWPTLIARSNGTVDRIQEGKITYRLAPSHKRITVSLDRSGFPLIQQVTTGSQFSKNQVIASVIPVTRRVRCEPPVDMTFYAAMLNSVSISDRYTACKAFRDMSVNINTAVLQERMNDPDEHVYVRLEAAAALATRNVPGVWERLSEFLKSEFAPHRLETVILLAEIPNEKSRDLLNQVLRDTGEDPEIRAGAAWAIGEHGDQSALGILIDCFSSMDMKIRVEAARSLLKIAVANSSNLGPRLRDTDTTKRAGIAWAMAKSPMIYVDQLIEGPIDDDYRQWLAYVVGSHKPAELVGDLEALRKVDPQVYFAASVLWKITSSWIYNLDRY